MAGAGPPGRSGGSGRGHARVVSRHAVTRMCLGSGHPERPDLRLDFVPLATHRGPPPQGFVCDPRGAWRLHPGDCRRCRRHAQDRRWTLVGSRTRCVAQSLRQSARHPRPPAPRASDRRCSSAAVLARAARLVSGLADRLPSESGLLIHGKTGNRQQRRPDSPDMVSCHPLPRCPARRIPRTHAHAGGGPACWRGGREGADELGAILVLVVSDSLPPPGLSEHSPGMHGPSASAVADRTRRLHAGFRKGACLPAGERTLGLTACLCPGYHGRQSRLLRSPLPGDLPTAAARPARLLSRPLLPLFPSCIPRSSSSFPRWWLGPADRGRSC